MNTSDTPHGAAESYESLAELRKICGGETPRLTGT
jgi:hypothetical protein